MKLYELNIPDKTKLDQFLHDKGFERIGRGAFAFVYSHPKFNYVLKIFTKHDKAYYDFIINKPDLLCFPKVIGKPVKFTNELYAVRLEKLNEKSSHINKQKLAYILNLIYAYPSYDDANIKDYFEDRFYEDKSLIKYIFEETDLLKGLEYIKSMGYIYDLHMGNIMFRNEYPVIVDPIKNTSNLLPIDIQPILKNPEDIYFYSRYVIKDIWPDGEKELIKDPLYAAKYATEVSGERWPNDVENNIKQNKEAWQIYSRYFKLSPTQDLTTDVLNKIKNLDGRDPTLEKRIIDSKNNQFALLYAKNIIGHEWPEAEHLFLENPEVADYYSKYVLKHRWPKGENVIKQNPRIWQEYKSRFNITENKKLIELHKPNNSEETIEFLQNKGFNIIGYGNNANIFYREGDKFILKVFNKTDVEYLNFITNKENNPHYPITFGKPISLNNNEFAIRIEKLNLDKKKSEIISLYSYFIAYLYYYRDIRNLNSLRILLDDDNNIIQSIMKRFSKRSFNKNSFLNFLRNNPLYFEALSNIMKNRNMSNMDLEPRNILFRQNTPVLIDPVM